MIEYLYHRLNGIYIRRIKWDLYQTLYIVIRVIYLVIYSCGDTPTILQYIKTFLPFMYCNHLIK